MSASHRQFSPAFNTIHCRAPTAGDGHAVWQLIGRCPPLDANSLYCNLLQCDHFGDTCIAAVNEQEALVGWVSGYLLPRQPSTLFIWQVAVDQAAQGQGLGKRMLRELLARPACRDVNTLQTTITTDNHASWRLFVSFAREHGGQMSDECYFHQDEHFAGAHASEHMVTIRLPV